MPQRWRKEGKENMIKVGIIGSTGYASLNEALAAVQDGQTIVLQQNVSSSTEAYLGGEAKGVGYVHDGAAKSFTIDLNQKKITATENADDALLILAEEGAGSLSVTLQNGTISASGTGVDGLCVQDYDTATPTTVTLRNMTVSADTSPRKASAWNRIPKFWRMIAYATGIANIATREWR